MMEILIHGIETSLGSHFAARVLRSPEIRVSYLPLKIQTTAEEVTSLVFLAAGAVNERPEGGNRQEIEERLRKHQSLGTARKVDEVWYFPTEASGARTEIRDELIATCSSMEARTFNYVAEDLNDGPARLSLDAEISEQCKAQGIQYRIFHLSLVLGSGGALEKFLAELHSLKVEIEARSPQYFDYQALRCLALENAILDLLPTGALSNLLAGFALKTGPTAKSYSISHPHATRFSVLCENISIAYGISLLPFTEYARLNAIDRLFDERISGFSRYFKTEIGGACDAPSSNIGTLFTEEALLDEQVQVSAFESIRRSQENELAIRKQEIAHLPGKLTRKTLTRKGFELDYYTGGAGKQTIIVLNAIGQGLEYWYPLLHELIQDYRVFIWEPRGTVSPPPPFGLEEQVNDVEAIVEQEGIEKCHLIGWCTGPRVAIEFHFRRLGIVQSMAFLNGTSKCAGSPEELDSPYEHNLETLCRLLVRKPAMADSVMKTLMARMEEGEVELLEGGDAEQISVRVLSRMNPELKSHVLAPFKTNTTTVNYAHQLVDFWAHDARPKAREVRVPVLLMGAEYDQVATPQASQEAATLFPNARHVFVRGATHYCLYDRPEFVADLLKKFFDHSNQASTKTTPAATESLAANAGVLVN